MNLPHALILVTTLLSGAMPSPAVNATTMAQGASQSRWRCPAVCSCQTTSPLRLVNCSSRSLRQFPDDLPAWTEILSLRNNKIGSRGTQGLERLRLLHQLDLSFNENLRQIGVLSFPGNPRLQSLKLDACALVRVPVLDASEVITRSDDDAAAATTTSRKRKLKRKRSPKIASLSLSHNSITEISKDAIRTWRDLKYLDLSDNLISSMSERCFVTCSKLTTLKLDGNRIESLSKYHQFDGLHRLVNLTLSRNNLRSLVGFRSGDQHRENCNPDLRSLKFIDLSYNLLETIDPFVFDGICNLESLDLTGNKLYKINDGALWNLKKLTKISLDYNDLTRIRNEWQFVGNQEEHIEHMSFANNKISELNENPFKFARSLISLDLSGNELRELVSRITRRGFLYNLASLESLDLSRNRITTIGPATFAGLDSLRYINLSRNSITCDAGGEASPLGGGGGGFAPFGRLGSLERIDLSRNLLTSVAPQLFRASSGGSGGSQLRVVDIRSNNITAVGNDSFPERLDALMIDSHAFLCDCKLVYFVSWLRQHQQRQHVDASMPTDGLDARCYHPSKLQGVRLDTIEPTSLKCGDHPVPFLTRQPPAVINTARGDNVTLECTATAAVVDRRRHLADVAMTTTWWRNGVEVADGAEGMRVRTQESSLEEHVVHSSVLLIHDIQYSHEDQYYCVVSNEYDKTRSDPTSLRVVMPPVIVERTPTTLDNNDAAADHSDDDPTSDDEIQTIVQRRGEKVVLKCEARGKPKPVVSWQRFDGGQFAAALDQPTRVLSLNQLPPAPATNNNNDSSPSSSAAVVGDLSLLSDDVTSDDDYDYEEEGEVEEVDESSMNIVIVDLKPEDSGDYVCQAASEFGKDQVVVRIVVQYAPLIKKPMPAETVARVGDQARLRCEVDAYPPPDIRWWYGEDGGQDSPLNITERHFVTNNDRLLIIAQLQPLDGGRYRCEASNKLGTMQTRTKLVVVPEGWNGRSGDTILSWISELSPGLVMSLVSLFAIMIVSVVWVCVLYRYTQQKNEEKKQQQYNSTTGTELIEYGNCEANDEGNDDYNKENYVTSSYIKPGCSNDAEALLKQENEEDNNGGGLSLVEYLRRQQLQEDQAQPLRQLQQHGDGETKRQSSDGDDGNGDDDSSDASSTTTPSRVQQTVTVVHHQHQHHQHHRRKRRRTKKKHQHVSARQEGTSDDGEEGDDDESTARPIDDDDERSSLLFAAPSPPPAVEMPDRHHRRRNSYQGAAAAASDAFVMTSSRSCGNLT